MSINNSISNTDLYNETENMAVYICSLGFSHSYKRFFIYKFIDVVHYGNKLQLPEGDQIFNSK